MNKFIKIIPQVVQINTDQIKKGDIYKIEDKLTCNHDTYTVNSVTENELQVVSLNRSRARFIKAADMENLILTKMKLVEDVDDKEKITVTGEYRGFTSNEKRDCENALDQYDKMIRNAVMNVINGGSNKAHNRGYFA